MPDDAPTTSTRRPSRLAGMVTGLLLSGASACGRASARAERSAASLTAPSGSCAVA